MERNIMALVAKGNGSGFYLTVTVTDNGNNDSTLEYELRGADFAAATANKAAILTALGNVSGSTIRSTILSYRDEEDAFAFPASGVENETKARIIVQLDGSTKKATYDIPAPVAGIFTTPAGDGANIVDILDTAMVAYNDIFEATGEAFISDGEDVDFMLRGRRVSVKKGLRGQ
jgi:hypothetical protein